MPEDRTGRCCCGRIRYRVTAPPTHETQCHCTICRRTSAAPFVAWFTVPVGAFEVVAGSPAVFSSSSHGRRTFCRDCGTPLTFRSTAAAGEIDVTTCSLDDPEAVAPRDHTHVASKVSWVSLADGLPAYPGARSA